MPTPTAQFLAPYTDPPPKHSLSLITSVLGATSNWLVLRFLCDALSPNERDNGSSLDSNGLGGRRRSVVLVSFMRGWDFWRAEARRIGLDLSRKTHERSFAFVDGVSELFAHESENPKSTPSTASLTTRNVAGSRRPHLEQEHNRHVPSGPVADSPHARSSLSWTKLRWSKEAGLDSIEKEIISVIDDLSGGTTKAEPIENDILLVVDQADFLLASTGPSMGVGSTELSDTIMGLRQRVHSTLVTTAADSPLMQDAFSSSQHPTPLATEHAGLVVALAHQSRMVMQLRELDTGVARDVSGVLRVSKGGRWEAEPKSTDDENERAQWEEKELLYFVQGDGMVRVFGRGE